MDRRQRQQLLERLRADARRIAGHFELEYKAIEAESLRVKARYGVCYEDGLIKIRLHHVRTGKALKYSSLIDTLCHELAHLVHFNHGPQFKAYFLELLGWAREQGIYQPDLRRARKFARAAMERREVARRRARQQAIEQPQPLPERRNGVPVFGESGAIDQANLWERLARHAGDETLAKPPPPPAPGSSSTSPRPRPAPRRQPPQARPQVQFALFAAEANSTPPARPRRRPHPSKPKPQRQLALFD